MPSVAVSVDGALCDGYAAPTAKLRGKARSRLFDPDDWHLWVLTAELEEGSSLEWTADHGEEALYLLSGSLEVDGSNVEPGSVVVVESAAPARVAATRPVRIMHFGTDSLRAPSDGTFGAPDDADRSAHVVGPDGLYVKRTEGHPLTTTMFADSACRTCRVNLFTVSGPDGYRTPSHVHSEDEIISVLEGELQVGRNSVRAGNSIAVPGGFRYGFSAKGDFKFINYRRDVSSVVVAPGSDPIIETSRLPGEAVGS